MRDLATAADMIRNVQGDRLIGADILHGTLNIRWLGPPPSAYGTSASPATIGSSGAEGTEAAETTAWDRAAQASGARGLTLSLVTRVGYFHTGDETLYGYTRDLAFDDRGMLVTCSGETRFTIDVPEAC